MQTIINSAPSVGSRIEKKAKELKNIIKPHVVARKIVKSAVMVPRKVDNPAVAKRIVAHRAFIT